MRGRRRDASRARRAIVAIPPAAGRRGSRTTRRCRATATSSRSACRWARWQVHGRLRRALLARGRAERAGAQRRRPGQADLRQLAAGRLARASCSASSRAATPATGARWTPAERRDAVVGRFARCSGRARRSPTRYVERLWAEEEWTRGCYGATCRPARWTGVRQRAARAGRADPLGRRGDRDGVERLHGRRGELRRARGGRGASGRRLTRRIHARGRVGVVRMEKRRMRDSFPSRTVKICASGISTGENSASRPLWIPMTTTSSPPASTISVNSID